MPIVTISWISYPRSFLSCWMARMISLAKPSRFSSSESLVSIFTTMPRSKATPPPPSSAARSLGGGGLVDDLHFVRRKAFHRESKRIHPPPFRNRRACPLDHFLNASSETRGRLLRASTMATGFASVPGSSIISMFFTLSSSCGAALRSERHAETLRDRDDGFREGLSGFHFLFCADGFPERYDWP